MGDTYDWNGGNGSFDTIGLSYDQDTAMSNSIPGSGDTAFIDSGGTISGDGNVGSLNIDAFVTFTGAVTAGTVEINGSAVSVVGGTLTGTSIFGVGAGAIVNVSDGGSIASGSGASNAIENVGGTIAVNGGTVSAGVIVNGNSWSLASGTMNAGRITVNGIGGVATLNIGAGGTVTDSTTAIGAPFGAGSVVTLHNGAVWTNSGDLDLGPSTTGTLDIDSGASMEVAGTLTAGTADLSVNAGSLSIGQSLIMNQPTGTLDIEAGGTVTGPASLNSMTVEAAITVDGGGAQLSGTYLYATGGMTVQAGTIASKNLLLGSNSGGASLATVQSGGLLNAAIAEIGAQSSDTAKLVVTTGGSLETGMQLLVGNAGTGGIAIDSGQVAADGGIDEGNPALDLGVLNAAALGTIVLDAGVLNVTGAADLGDAGAGAMLLGTNSTFTVAAGLYEGVQSSSGGDLQVVDASNSFSVGGNWVIGDAGGHVDTISGGASASVGGALTIARGGGSGSLTITGTGSAVGVTGAITVGLSGSGTLQVEAGAALTGGGNFSVGTGSADIGDGSRIGANNVTIDDAGSLSLAGGTLIAGNSVEVSGQLSGNGTIEAPVTADGTVTASGSLLVVQGLVDGTGVVNISGSTLELQAGSDAGPTIDFAGGTLLFDTSGATGATLADFGAGDTIVLKGVIANFGTFAAGTLTLDSGTVAQATLSLSGAYDSDNFSVVPLGNQTTVTYVACFAAGVRILTLSGEVAVEALAPGELVVTRSGRARPVRWIGHRRIEPARHPRPREVCPVRVCAHAFAPGMPHRDLLLSPDHGVFTQDGLIPVRYLVNGATVVQEAVAEITYYHLELPAHDVVLANGLPSESYLDTGNRAAFANGGAAVSAHADFALGVWARSACAPLVIAGAKLTAAKRVLLDRAALLGHAQTDDAELHLLADGVTVRPEIDGMVHRFTLPQPAASLRLVSRAAVPAEVFADSTDARRLGVAVARLAVDGYAVPPHDPRRGAGWYSPEPGMQWTDGDARLRAPGARRVEVVLLPLLPLLRYWRRRAAEFSLKSQR